MHGDRDIGGKGLGEAIMGGSVRKEESIIDSQEDGKGCKSIKSQQVDVIGDASRG